MGKCRVFILVMLLCSVILTPPVMAQDNGAKRVTMEFKGESLPSVFKKLEKLSGYKILFTYDDVSKYQATGSLKDATVKNALDVILKGKPLEYKIEGNFINVTLRKTGSSDNGSKKISGVVVSKEDGLPIIGATVRIVGTDKGTATDFDGKFELNEVAANSKIQISYIGMKSQTLVAAADMNIVMENDAQTLQDVVVTGIFRKSRESYTGAVSTVTKEQLKMYKGQNIIQTLKNADASLNIPMSNSMGSDPNALPQMNIRGTSSLPMSVTELNETTRQSVNTPLIIMDGFEISLTKLMDYNDEEIESITILKDASATAIYGSRGANGVIVVETVKPEAGKLKVSATVGINLEVPDLTSYDLLDAREKLELERLAGLYNAEGKPSTEVGYQELYYKRLKSILEGAETDWMSLPLQTGVGQNYNVRLDGGSQEFRWGTSLSYRDVTGAMKGSSRRTFNGDITLMYNYKNLLFRNSTNISNSLSDQSPYGSFSTYVSQQPYNRPYDEEGNLIRYFGNFYGTSENTNQNPLYNATLNTFSKSRTLSIMNNFSIDWNILPELTLRGQLGISAGRSTSDDFYPAEHSMFSTSAYESGEGLMRKGAYNYGTGETFSYDGRITLSYSKVFKDVHQLYVGLDYSLSESKSENYSFAAEGFTNEDMNFLSNAMQYKENSAPGGSISTSRRVGFTGNVNYTYDNRYYIDGSYRMDGSSQFGSEDRYAPFWSVGIGWNLHHEKFIKDHTDIFSNLRLKASYGITGTMDFGKAAIETMYVYNSSLRYKGWSVAHLQGLGNPNLTWQETASTNIGFELGLFEQRFSLMFDWYKKVTDGLVSTRELPLAMGFSSYSENAGKVENIGFELSANAYIIRDYDRELSWMLSGQLVYNKNKILKLSEGMKRQSENYLVNGASTAEPAHLLFEGRSMYDMYAVRSLGIDPADGKELFLDKNGNVTNVWDSRNFVYVGTDATYSSPYRGNASSTLRWKEWTLNVSCSYQWGGQTYNSTLRDRVEVPNSTIRSGNVDARVFEARWQKPGDRTFFKGYDDYETKATSRFVMDDNVFEIQSISLQYRLATEAIRKAVGVQSILLGVNMSNLWRFSTIKYERGTDYPFARNIQGNVTFLF